MKLVLAEFFLIREKGVYIYRNSRCNLKRNKLFPTKDFELSKIKLYVFTRISMGTMKMASSTVENYLKRLCVEQQHNNGKIVSMGRLAETMDVSPGTATSMVKVLAKSGLVNYEPRSGSRLTAKGRRLALHVLRRHRLVELFLVQVLGLDWSEIHEEAERLEHAVSDKVLGRIDQFLGFPSVDPHGDPIPSATGEFAKRQLNSLSDCKTGERIRIARVLDQNTSFLKLVNQYALVPGTLVVVTNRDALADAITLDPDGSQRVTLGLSAASKISVEKVPLNGG